MRKGIILAGGNATRLKPLTNIISKQLLPIYDKPMIYYPLSVLMLSNIKDILIISSKEFLKLFKNLLGNGKKLGIKISYKIQKKPSGIAESLILAEDFLENKACTLILGDNIFFGNQLSKKLLNANQSKKNTIFLYPVSNPQDFGIAEIKKSKISSITEKPKNYISNMAIVGLYFFDKNASKYAKEIKPSNRNELEITDLIKIYHYKKLLNFEILGRGFAWLDTGTFDRLIEASNFVKTIQSQQGFYIACPEEIAIQKKWATKKKMLENIKGYEKSEYYQYIRKLCK
jgi:glucose-1-phosphate thymidylyltransferase